MDARQQPEDDATGQALAAARLADHADARMAIDLERDVAERLAAREFDRQALHLKQRAHRGRLSLARSASATRLSARPVIASRTPGAIVIHHADSR